MADLTITASQVVQSTNGADIDHGKSGEAIAIGQCVYVKASDTKVYLADADLSEAAAAAVGIAVSAASAANQSVSYQKSGTMTLGAAAAPSQGAIYCVSATAGGIAPEADLTTGDYVTILGVGEAANTLVMPSRGVVVSGVDHV